MKKVFMFLGLALCVTGAMAQTNDELRRVKTPTAERFQQLRKDAERVDYKASIFTKDEVRDTITGGFFDFSNMTGINYGTNAKVNVNDVIGNDTAKRATSYDAARMANLLPHTRTDAISHWRHYDSAAALRNDNTNIWHNPYGHDVAYVMGDTGILGNDNGFMMIDLYDIPNPTYSRGTISSYIEFPTVTRDAEDVGKLVSVSMAQLVYRAYERHFIDYKVGDHWYTREVNTDIDDFNHYIYQGFVLPFNLRNEQEIKIRIRVQSYGRGGIYGCYWAIDNVAVCVQNRQIGGTTSGDAYIDGFYGTIPQGMNIPLTYGVNVRNTAVQDLPKVRTIGVGGAAENPASWSIFVEGDSVTVPAGDIDAKYSVYINGRGFIDPDQPLDSVYRGLFYPAETYATTSDLYDLGFVPSGLPAADVDPGTYGYQLWTVYGDARTINYTDTIYYTVSQTENPSITGATVDGARWSHDNGAIPSGSLFGYQLYEVTRDGETRSYYGNGPAVIDSNNGVPVYARHYLEEGYTIWVAYTTGDEIPEGYVFRGIEYIPSTDTNTSLAGSQISVEAYRVGAGGQQYYLGTGCDAAYALTDDMKDRTFTTGYKLPGDNYQAVNIQFPMQPELEPNTTYLFGYKLQNSGNFSVAATSNRYKVNADSNSYLTRNTDSKFYGHHARPYGAYSILIEQDEENYLSGHNFNSGEEWPMIRPIVGEPLEVAQSFVSVDCEKSLNGHDEDDVKVTVEFGNTEIGCGESDQAPAGHNLTVYFIPDTLDANHTIIDSVYLNGEKLTAYNQATGTGRLSTISANSMDVNVYSEDGGSILLRRNAYGVVVFDDELVDEENGAEFVVYAHYADFNGIDPVAANISMSLVPNPATGMVKMNLDGVEGTVNCSIIDMSGRVVYNANVNAAVENSINLSGIPAGAYFVRVTNDLFSKVEKLIVR